MPPKSKSRTSFSARVKNLRLRDPRENATIVHDAEVSAANTDADMFKTTSSGSNYMFYAMNAPVFNAGYLDGMCEVGDSICGGTTSAEYFSDVKSKISDWIRMTDHASHPQAVAAFVLPQLRGIITQLEADAPKDASNPFRKETLELANAYEGLLNKIISKDPSKFKHGSVPFLGVPLPPLPHVKPFTLGGGAVAESGGALSGGAVAEKEGFIATLDRILEKMESNAMFSTNVLEQKVIIPSYFVIRNAQRLAQGNDVSGALLLIEKFIFSESKKLGDRIKATMQKVYVGAETLDAMNQNGEDISFKVIKLEEDMSKFFKICGSEIRVLRSYCSDLGITASPVSEGVEKLSVTLRRIEKWFAQVDSTLREVKE